MRRARPGISRPSATGSRSWSKPYRRKIVTFKNVLDRELDASLVKVDRVRKDESDLPLKYDPTNPAADEKGYVRMPNVNTLVELMDMREAQRSYEANLNMIEVSKSMLTRTLDLLR